MIRRGYPLLYSVSADINRRAIFGDRLETNFGDECWSSKTLSSSDKRVHSSTRIRFWVNGSENVRSFFDLPRPFCCRTNTNWRVTPRCRFVLRRSREPTSTNVYRSSFYRQKFRVSTKHHEHFPKWMLSTVPRAFNYLRYVVVTRWRGNRGVKEYSVASRLKARRRKPDYVVRQSNNRRMSSPSARARRSSRPPRKRKFPVVAIGDRCRLSSIETYPGSDAYKLFNY